MLKSMIIILLVFSISILTTSAMAETMTTVEIILSSETYSFGDKLEYQIVVSEITHENAVLYITDESGKKSQLLSMPIEIENTLITAQFPFDSIVWKEGTYIIDVEYSGASSTTTFDLLSNGSVGLPFWFTDITIMWINDEATDKDYVRNIILQLIEQKIINESYPNYLDEEIIFIPTWYKTVAEWWTLGFVSDSQLVNNLKFLLEKNIIVIT